MVKITIEFDTLAEASPILAYAIGRSDLIRDEDPRSPPTSATEVATPPRKRRSRAEAAEAPPAPAPEPVTPPAVPASDWDEDEPPPPAASPPVTKDDVRAALVAYQGRTSMEKAQALLKDVGGVEKLGALPESKYADVIKATQSAK